MSARLPELVAVPIRQTTQRALPRPRRLWMDVNCARLNSTKTERVWFGRGAVNFRQMTLCAEPYFFSSLPPFCSGDTSRLSRPTRPRRLPGRQHVSEVARYQARVDVLWHPSTDSQHQTISSTVNTVDAHLHLRRVKTGLYCNVALAGLPSCDLHVCSPSSTLPAHA